MNITEAVNMILKRYPDYGYDIFLDLNKIKDDDGKKRYGLSQA